MLYFMLMKYLSITLVIMSIISIPAIVSNYLGKGMVEGDRVSIDRGTIGNQATYGEKIE
jgi:hypothetical protein